MKNSIVFGLIGLVVGALVGYVAFGSDAGMSTADSAKLAESVTMMKDQATNIKQMAELMKENGAMMQEMGMKYKDDLLVSGGKDLEVVSAKYMKNSTGSTMMDKMMSN